MSDGYVGKFPTFLAVRLSYSLGILITTNTKRDISDKTNVMMTSDMYSNLNNEHDMVIQCFTSSLCRQ